jgi:hypothetical protein
LLQRMSPKVAPFPLRDQPLGLLYSESGPS